MTSRSSADATTPYHWEGDMPKQPKDEESTQVTPKRAEIPVPTSWEFFRDLAKVSKRLKAEEEPDKEQ
jgi:hypothetical protein